MKLVPCLKKYIVPLIGILLTSTSLSFAQGVGLKNISSVSVLQEFVPVERDLLAGAIHSYLVVLQKAQVLEVEINELGVDVIIRTFSPEKDMLSEIDLSENNWGKELIEIKARHQGIYRLEVSSLKKAGALGKYNIRIIGTTTAGRSGPKKNPYK